MKIIKQSKNLRGLVFEGVCPICECRYEFESREKYLHYSDLGGVYLRTSCPNCGHGVLTNVKSGRVKEERATELRDKTLALKVRP